MKRYIMPLLLMVSFLLLPLIGDMAFSSIYDVQASMDQPTVLVLNAYHRGYGWTDSQTDAIIADFEQHPSSPIYYIEYLDWKRQPNESNLVYQSQLMAHKYKDVDIDVIIGTDDIGMQFAIDNRDVIAPDAPIVFTGVFEDTAKKRMAGVDNITGVYESIDPFGTMEMVLAFHPDLKHVYVINDHSATGIDVETKIMEGVTYYANSHGFTYELLHDKTYEEIEEILLSPAPDSVVVIGTHNYDSAGNMLPNEVFCQYLADTIEIPMYSPYEYLFDHGIVGGSLLSGTLQGARAAELTDAILDDTPVETLDGFDVKTVYTGIDFTYAQRFEVPIERLGDDVTIINRPVSIFEMYRSVIITTIGIIVILSFFIVLLSINIRVRKRTQYELEIKHEELFETYENLASSEEELKAQNDELVEQQKEINHLAFYDKLTDLPNRNAVDLHIKNMVNDRGTSRTLLMIVDLDNFNYINTAYGHRFGDHLLKTVGNAFRKLEADGFYVGRIAGDEFYVSRNLHDSKDERDTLERVDRIFEAPFQIDGKEITVSKSIGYTIHPDDGRSYDELLTRTDMAKKKMKRRGKNLTSRFVSSMSKEMSDRIVLTKALKTAVSNDEMYLVYQPQYNVKTGNIVGFEALARWESPMVGNVRPDTFISLAEETGEIINIGFFVLEAGMKFLNRYEEEFDQGFKLSLNISVLQLLRQDFIEQVRSMMQLYDIDPGLLEFEVTESILIQSFEVVNERLIQLKLMGVSISLDDFGTGYSSLTYLEKLPIDTVKIDKSFIDGIVLEGEEHFFSASIVDLAHRMGLRVIAEGVEVKQQVDYLNACGCKVIQGYWYSKPLDEEDVMKLYRQADEAIT